MRGNAIGKPEMLLEPLLVVLSPDANCLRPICPGDHCHDRNNQEVTEYMQAINMRPRILQIFKTGKNRINVIELDLGHKRRLSKGNWGRISAPIYHCQKTARAQLALDSLSNPECALAVSLMVPQVDSVLTKFHPAEREREQERWALMDDSPTKRTPADIGSLRFCKPEGGHLQCVS